MLFYGNGRTSGSRGDGYSDGSNAVAGGAPGRAQAVLPANIATNSTAPQNTFFVYVGDSGVGGVGNSSGAGGAASMVTFSDSPVPTSFLEDDCQVPPEQIGAVVIAGGGGGGGSSWARSAGKGVTIPPALRDWQPLSNNDPSQVVITVHCPGDSCL